MFRFSSLTMRRLLLFLVFAAIGAPNPVEDFDEWDFQRRQDILGIVNGSHSISGAAFTPEPPVVLVKALKTLWTYIPFPEIPQLDPKPLNQILDQALFELNDLDLRMFQHECADAHLFLYWKQLLRDNLAEVFQSHQIFKTDLEIMRQSLTVFLNSSLQDQTFERPNRYKRSLLVPIVGTALGSELSRVFLRPFTAPIADKFSCFVDKLVPFGSLCKEDERKKIEALARQVKDLEENVFYLKSKLLEAITVRMPADVERRKLPALKRSLQENVEMLNETIRGVLEEIKDYVEKGECVARLTQDRHRNTYYRSVSSEFNDSIPSISNWCKPATYFAGQYGFLNARFDGFVSARILADSVDSSNDPFENFRHVWGVRMERGDSEKTNSCVLYFWSCERRLYIGRGVAFADWDTSLYGTRSARRIPSNPYSPTDTADRTCDAIPPVENALVDVMG